MPLSLPLDCLRFNILPLNLLWRTGEMKFEVDGSDFEDMEDGISDSESESEMKFEVNGSDVEDIVNDLSDSESESEDYVSCEQPAAHVL